ncbi:hypothetical protein BRD01_03235 [Halobacteriales archaeon QS_8_65_32]|nr:MAG: hypothetical protein BRD01_03235 [Halobacteriales archaeon QS_8_65_32]
MELWGWVVAYVVGFSLLQVLIYRYLRDRDDAGTNATSGERSLERTAPPREHPNTDRGPAVGESSHGIDSPDAPGNADRGDGHRDRVRAASTSGRHCPRCGTLNDVDPGFTYCRECVRPLG